MDIAIQKQVCYNNSVKAMTISKGQQNEAPICIRVQIGASPFLLYWQSTQLFVVLVIPVQPFAYVISNYACCNRDQKRNGNFHKTTSSRCRVLVGQRYNYNIYCYNILQFFPPVKLQF